MKSSWKTTAASVAALLSLLLTVAKQLLDNDPTTNPDWAVVLPLIFAALTGLFARDDDKTSEEVGAK